MTQIQRSSAALLTLISAGSAAHAQDAYRLTITADPPVLEPGQTASLRILAEYDEAGACAFASVMTDLLMSIHAGALEDVAVAPGPWCCSTPGTVDPSGVRDIVVGQIGDVGGIIPDRTNPIALWVATFRAPDVVRSQPVIMATRSYSFNVYTGCCGHCPGPEPRLSQLAEAFFTLWVMPCRADLDDDGALTFFDFLTFQNLFAAEDVRADFDFDGAFTLFDFLAFQNSFAGGC